MKVGIIGAGISGLSIGKILQEHCNVTILEKEEYIGGIAHVKNMDGIPYHLVGGHCFNSKKKEVLDFVFDKVMPLEDWHKIDRNSVINIRGNNVPYPIEFSVKQIANFDTELAFEITKDFLATSSNANESSNLREWFIQTFGRKLAETYFIPYNQKIWGRDISLMSPDWVKDKLPIPDKKEFFLGLIGAAYDKMPHSTFYYPNANTQNAFINALAEGSPIITKYEVKCVEKSGSKWIINGELEFDLIVNTGPLDTITPLIKNCPSDVTESAKRLKFNRVTTVFWKCIPDSATWVYFPESNIPFHRRINIGTFLKPIQGYCITECIGERSFEFATNFDWQKFGLIEPLSYNVSGPAYVIFDESRNLSLSEIFSYFDSIGLITLGRFGEWQYYNMDVCILKAIETANSIRIKYQF